MKVEIRLVFKFVTLADSVNFSEIWPKNVKTFKVPIKMKVTKTRKVSIPKIQRQPMPSFVKKKFLLPDCNAFFTPPTSGLMGVFFFWVPKTVFF